MAIIFLSYRRTDGPQACRMFDWLGQRFGYDSIFMDVARIPIAENFPDYIRGAIEKSGVLIALIGSQWTERIREERDPVRMEIEAAVENEIPVLPVLIGNTPMPDVDELPESIAAIASQNAFTVGEFLDFHSHMKMLLPTIEAILGALSATSIAYTEPYLIQRACSGIIDYLRAKSGDVDYLLPSTQWMVMGVEGFSLPPADGVTLYLHRVRRLAEDIELHFILSYWAREASTEQVLAAWVMSLLERTPIVPSKFIGSGVVVNECSLKVRLSDEDPRQVWKTITDNPLRLSLTYVATVSPKEMGARGATLRPQEDAGKPPVSDADRPPLGEDSPHS